MKIATLLLAILLPLSAFSQFTPKHHFRLGYKPDVAGFLDKNLKGTVYRATPIQPHTDLSALIHAAYDQGQEGSCVGHGCDEAFEIALLKITGKPFTGSRAFPYWLARMKEGTTGQDDGCQIRDCVSQMMVYGNCTEALCSYNAGEYGIAPSKAAYVDGKMRLVLRAYKVDCHDGVSIRQALSAGFPVVFGSLIYPEFEDLNASRYVVPMPRKGERSLGGHCQLIIGSDDATGYYDVLNSWGPSWGNKGRSKFPYAYIHGKDTDDAWVIELVQVPSSPEPTPKPKSGGGFFSWLGGLFR